MPKKDSHTKDSLLENLRKNYPNDLKLEGGFNAQLDKAIDKKELTIKDVKKALGIKDADIAEMFDFKNVMAYRNSSAKPRIEKGIINIYKIIQK
jgi:predicted alpha/beta-fold hydrolase